MSYDLVSSEDEGDERSNGAGTSRRESAVKLKEKVGRDDCKYSPFLYLGYEADGCGRKNGGKGMCLFNPDSTLESSPKFILLCLVFMKPSIHHGMFCLWVLSSSRTVAFRLGPEVRRSAFSLVHVFLVVVH